MPQGNIRSKNGNPTIAEYQRLILLTKGAFNPQRYFSLHSGNAWHDFIDKAGRGFAYRTALRSTLP